MNREEQILREMAKSMGLDFLLKEDRGRKSKDLSPYYDETGKRYTNKEATRHEIVYDKEGNSMPNPVARNIESYPLMPTPLGNVVETVANASAEINPLLGLIAGAMPYGSGGYKGATKPKNPYMQDYGNDYIKANDYVDGALDAYKKRSYDLPSHTNSQGVNGVMVQGNNVGVKITKDEMDKINAGKNQMVTRLQDETRRAGDLGGGVYPVIDNNNNIQGIYPISLQKRVDDMYGKDAIDFLDEGVSEMGYMRGLENKKPKGGKVFGKTEPQLEMDIAGPEHAEAFSTIGDWGEGLELARRISKENADMPLARFITPGGTSTIPLGADWHSSMFTGAGYRNYFDLAKRYDVDPAFMNYELDRLSEQSWDIYKALTPTSKKLGGYPLSDYMNSEWIKRVQRGDKYPIINQSDVRKGFPGNWTEPGQPFMNKDGTFWLHDEYINPRITEQWDNIRTNKANAWEGVHFMDMPDVHPYIQSRFNDEGGYLGNMRLSAKPSRMDNLTLGRVGKPILDENGNPTGQLYDAPFTRQFVDIVGDKNQLSPFAMERIFGNKGLIRGVEQLRSAQGLTNPNNPIISRGFGDSNYIQEIMKGMTNKDKAIARDAWKLGVVPFLQSDEENE